MLLILLRVDQETETGHLLVGKHLIGVLGGYLLDLGASSDKKSAMRSLISRRFGLKENRAWRHAMPLTKLHRLNDIVIFLTLLHQQV